MNNQTLIDALERELAGYIRRGLTARADAVRHELHRLGSSKDVTVSEVVPPEPVGTPKPTTRAKKAPEPTKQPEAPKTPARRRKAAP